MRLADSHCHIHFEQFDEDRSKVIEDIEDKLDFAVLAGVDLEDNLKAKETAEKSESLKYCTGLHPLYFEESKVKDVEDQIERFSPSAVGEIGLDYNYITDKDKRRESEKVFREMLEVAEDKGLPVVVHSRNAEQKCFNIVEEFEVKAFFHCFNGRPRLAKEISETGHLIGVTNQIHNSSRVQNIVKEVELEFILTETDSPYLGGDERNTPLAVIEIAEKISEIKDVSEEKVIEISSRNSRKFFR